MKLYRRNHVWVGFNTVCVRCGLDYHIWWSRQVMNGCAFRFIPRQFPKARRWSNRECIRQAKRNASRQEEE